MLVDFFAEKECLRFKKGDSYLGKINMAGTKVCDTWTSLESLTQSMHAEIADGTLENAHNYCRTLYFPNEIAEFKRPICFTDNVEYVGECEIDYCGKSIIQVLQKF